MGGKPTGAVSVVHSGDVRVGGEGDVLTATLGSCVAVLVHDPERRLGGMCHYLLPRQENVIGEDLAMDPFRSGERAIVELLRLFKNAGARRERLVAKIVGGAQVSGAALPEALQVGAENVRVAREKLACFKVRVVAEETGGDAGRSVRFDCATGVVRFRRESGSGAGLLVGDQPSGSQARAASPMTSRPVRVLIVDDSAPMRLVLRKMLADKPGIEVVGEAEDAEAAELERQRLRPDVLTLDLHMPKKDGVSYLRQLMAEAPLPVIVVTDYQCSDSGPVMAALEAGAFDYVQKPALAELESVGAELAERIRAAGSLDVKKLVRSLGKRHPVGERRDQKSGKRRRRETRVGSCGLDRSLLVLGASTGGTEALKSVLERLPAEMPPVVIVQHMPANFTRSFAERLDSLSELDVKEAEDGDELRSGCAYVAPGGRQLAIVQRLGSLRISLRDDPAENRFRPSVDYLFRSVAQLKDVARTAVILTGMGADGAREMLELKKQGVRTIAQDEASCVVFGMPRAAVEIGAVSEVLPLDEIARALIQGEGKKAA